MDFLDDLNYDDNKGQTVKSNEINGERFLFHSLPKEFQDWHNIYYLSERTGDPDRSVVSDAYLNGYMWQSIGDASYYALGASTAIIIAVIKLRLSVNFLNLLFVLSVFLPIIIYIAYHFIYYGKIRAMKVGVITEQAIKNTSIMFYQTFIAVSVSIIITFLFCLLFINDLLYLLALLINNSYNEGSTGMIINVAISVHNMFVKIAHPGSAIYENTFIIFTIFTLVSAFFCIWFEHLAYSDKKKEVQQDIKITESKQGYPIENAQRIMTRWREKNGF